MTKIITRGSEFTIDQKRRNIISKVNELDLEQREARRELTQLYRSSIGRKGPSLRQAIQTCKVRVKARMNQRRALIRKLGSLNKAIAQRNREKSGRCVEEQNREDKQ